MTFLFPPGLWLTLVVPILVGLYIWAQRRRQKYALRYASLSLVKDRFHSSNTLDRSKCASDSREAKHCSWVRPHWDEPLCFPQAIELCYA